MLQRLNDIHTIVLHHSASPRETTTAARIAGWHRDKGWIAVGYHYIIEADGALRRGRPIDMVPAAQSGANTGTIAVCVVGDNTKPGEAWTAAQRLSVRSIVTMLRAVLPRPVAFRGHCDVAVPGHATLCPGLDVREQFPDLAKENGDAAG